MILCVNYCSQREFTMRVQCPIVPLQRKQNERKRRKEKEEKMRNKIERRNERKKKRKNIRKKKREKKERENILFI